MSYKITATYRDKSGTKLTANEASTLGDAFGVVYKTRAEAETEKEYLDETKEDVEGLAGRGVEYAIEECEGEDED